MLKRVHDAHAAMNRSGPSARGANDFKAQFTAVQALLPRVYMALGRARIRVLEAQGVLEGEAAPDEPAGPDEGSEPDGSEDSKQ